MSADAECPFCQPGPGKHIADHGLVRILWDSFPVSPGHALVVPLRHVAAWRDLTAAEKQALVEGVDQARAAIARAHAPDGYNLGINDGTAAGQTVMHLHLHVIPRYRGDCADPRGGVRWSVPDKARLWEPDE